MRAAQASTVFLSAVEWCPERALSPARVEGLSSSSVSNGYFVYIVRCADGSLYTGYARDPEKRIDVHNSGRGALYTCGRRPVILVHTEEFDSASDALKREQQLKCWSKKKKEALVARDLVSLKRL